MELEEEFGGRADVGDSLTGAEDGRCGVSAPIGKDTGYRIKFLNMNSPSTYRHGCQKRHGGEAF